MVFSPNTPLHLQGFLQDDVHVEQNYQSNRYLGLPVDVTHHRSSIFSNLLQRIQRRITAYKVDSLSIVGRVVLARHVLSSLPTMVAFKLPVSTSRAIDKTLARFIWNGDRDGRQLHWKAWSTVCKSRFHGGLGMRSSEAMNQALLALIAWRMLRHPDALLSRFYAARYCRQYDLLSVQPGKNATWGWRGVLWGRDLLKTGLKWQVANGERIPISANWIPNSPNPLAFCTWQAISPPMVSSLIDVNREWCIPSLRALFPDHIVHQILSIYLPSPGSLHKDRQFWALDSSGEYTVRSALSHRGLSSVARCVRCGLKGETTSHMLLDCDDPRLIWRLSSLGFDFTSGTACSFADWFVDWMEHALVDDVRSQSLFLLWEIWKDRNCHVFSEADLPPPHEMVARALWQYQSYSPCPSSIPLDSGGSIVLDQVGLYVQFPCLQVMVPSPCLPAWAALDGCFYHLEERCFTQVVVPFQRILLCMLKPMHALLHYL
ncbi:OLC1v1033276C1 [Oldenlandia corymbosa var. corymbosa]|uniref:OLC1v1033276C1 n=1 Tax=Oldenlandia corymbosa var. corymbosa TaxID=529605 RepID=A0AAV1CNQ6_OLDCO|nr:OLC1v1033276C1 [Oldenlandia corymbosa var. corymbosa]